MMRLLAIVLLAALCGCASVQPVDPAQAHPDPRSVLMFAGHEGEPLWWDDLLAAAGAADVVIIGENHNHPLGLAVAAALWDDVLAQTESAALSMEFFARDEQSRLDDYLAGLSDEAVFKRRTGRTDGNYPPAHRQMVEAARDAGRPVIAANAPRGTVRLASRHGFERIATLTPEQQRLIRVPDHLPEGRYRDDFYDLMRDAMAEAHGIDEGDPAIMERMIDGMFRAQSLWDWTMAESIARAAEEGRRPIVHIVGRFHSDFDGGLVQALEALLPGAEVLTISMAPNWSDMLEEDDLGRADVVIYVGPGS